MGLKVVSKELNGLLILEPDVYSDNRGFFYESYRADEFEAFGIPTNFVQDNHSKSAKGVLRGMHFQWEPPQGKLLRVTYGKAFVAEIDIRPGSPTLGKWFGIEMSSDNKLIMWVPPGFANGFCATSEWMEMQYKCTALWNVKGESSILWNDPDVGIDWPIDEPTLSEKDKNGFKLTDWLKKPESLKLKYNSIKF
jgi:dTDP-4-dehydrorhamnose 3,5-epimerase